MTSETDNKVEAAVERLKAAASRAEGYGHADAYALVADILTIVSDRDRLAAAVICYRKTMEAMVEAPDAIAALIASKEAADQRCDRLAAEVERLTAWGNERHAAAREAMDTAYHLQYPPSPELLESIAERIDCGGDCETAWREWDTNAAGCTKSDTDGCPFEEAASLRDFAKALRVQALASLDRTAPGEPTGEPAAWGAIPPGLRFGRRLTADAVEALQPGTLLRFHSPDPWFDHSGDMPQYGEIVRFTGNVGRAFPLVGDHLEVQALSGRVYPGGGWVFNLFQFVGEAVVPEPAQEVAGLVVEALIHEHLRRQAGLPQTPDMPDCLHADDTAKAIVSLLASSPSKGGETVDRSGVAAADNNHKALVEAGEVLQAMRKMHAANPTRDAAYAVGRASDFFDEALAAFTTKGMDHG